MDRKLPDNGHTDELVQLLLANQKRIYAYIFTLVPSWADADDIMQDVVSVLLKKYPLQKVDNFVAWAMQIAHYKVLDFRKKNGRAKVFYNEELLEVLSDYVASVEPKKKKKLSALEGCLEKLQNKDYDLIMLRYQKDMTLVRMAKQLEISKYAVFRAVQKIQDILGRCIKRKLIVEE